MWLITTSMIQLKVILDRRKPKTNGTCPIYYWITEKKKVAYIYTGFLLYPPNGMILRTKLRSLIPCADY
ncbi:Arm DNA-binding domain-containing protein [Mucilaginibacter gilvus]|uniref:Arm DNA-binding domain-containing protein n=1 Tax=Mucilaginibacter gilvus TaxID=2305909 RepID=A0A444MV54_9SPHI|nr:hypothetical protein EPL05_03015 [Mucilaginibacter gilvus]